ncbi:MAG: hypothetical protein EOP21_13790, partial [Hyphomicrobiales bacterium]
VLQAEESRYQCALCQDALYCSDKCRIGDLYVPHSTKQRNHLC